MLLRFCLRLLPVLLPAVTLGQPTGPQLTGQLTDTAGQPLPFATVGVVGRPVGTVADAAGRFRLALPAAVTPADSVRFALLGYRSRTFPVGVLPPSPLTLALPEAPAALPEATVRARTLRRHRIGNHNWNARMQTNFALGDQPGQNVGSEIGRVFQLPRGGAWLDTLRFAIGNTFDSVRLRVNVYALTEGRPGRPLLTQPIYLTRVKNQRGWAVVDLRPANLFVPDDAVVLAVEWVSHSPQTDKATLAIPITVPAFGTHLYRYGAANTWKRFPGMSACLELIARAER